MRVGSRKTKFCHFLASLVHPASLVVFLRAGVLVKAVPRYCHLWERLFGPSQPRQLCPVCVLVNTFQYHDTVDFL